MNLDQIFAVTILIDNEHHETHHVPRPDGTAPEYQDISGKLLPKIRQQYHPGSDFEIIEAEDVKSSLELFNSL
ncbi:hypothetical protein [Vibrio owensii]|uniref:hypothetical protein n=1 Tax=Vibrio harveyi group TaxID=717610 RepID=UPI003CC52573